MFDITNQKLIFNYSVEKYDFQLLFFNHLKSFLPNINESFKIADLHKYFLNTPKDLITVDNDQDQEIYKLLYMIDSGYSFDGEDKSKQLFLNLFDNFVNFLASDIFDEDLIYQSKPTLRVMFPNNKAVGDWHRDREYNHPLEEINVWVPITSASNTNSIWLESSFDKEDYEPANLDYGQFLIFDSGLKHGNVLNKENKTRLSFDFRVIPRSKYKEPSNASSYSQNIEFKIGHYYSETHLKQ